MNNNNNIPQAPILNIEVQLTDDKSEPLNIYEGDDIEKRVDFFINDHKLPKEIKNVLIQEIMNKLEASISQMEKNLNKKKKVFKKIIIIMKLKKKKKIIMKTKNQKIQMKLIHQNQINYKNIGKIIIILLLQKKYSTTKT